MSAGASSVRRMTCTFSRMQHATLPFAVFCLSVDRLLLHSSDTAPRRLLCSALCLLDTFRKLSVCAPFFSLGICASVVSVSAVVACAQSLDVLTERAVQLVSEWVDRRRCCVGCFTGKCNPPDQGIRALSGLLNQGTSSGYRPLVDHTIFVTTHGSATISMSLPNFLYYSCSHVCVRAQSEQVVMKRLCVVIVLLVPESETKWSCCDDWIRGLTLLPSQSPSGRVVMTGSGDQPQFRISGPGDHGTFAMTGSGSHGVLLP